MVVLIFFANIPPTNCSETLQIPRKLSQNLPDCWLEYIRLHIKFMIGLVGWVGENDFGESSPDRGGGGDDLLFFSLLAFLCEGRLMFLLVSGSKRGKKAERRKRVMFLYCRSLFFSSLRNGRKSEPLSKTVTFFSFQ